MTIAGIALTEVTIAGMTIYQILWYFLLYSFCGWVIEVIYHAVAVGKVINRGFLGGPLCPVYGFGMLAVIAVSNLAEDSGYLTVSTSDMNVKSLALLFLGSLVFATLIELIAGWLLDVNFHMRWWDYSKKPFNFHGYICLEFSIIWGLSITAAILVIHPMMEDSPSLGIPARIGWPLLGIFYVLLLADFCVTVAIIHGLNKRLAELDRLQKGMRVVSDRMSQTIGGGTIKTAQRIGEGQVQMALAKAELRDTASQVKEEQAVLLAKRKAQFDELLEQLKTRNPFTPGRILRNVPELQHSRYKELLESLKQRILE